MSASNSRKKVCSFVGCERKAESGGLCNGHYLQQWRGKTLVPIWTKTRKRGSPPRINCDEVMCPRLDLIGMCHVFRGSKVGDGYGHVSVNGKSIAVHKYIWEQINGPTPKGMEIDHQCRNRGCCNEDHLRCVTKKVNCLENSISFSATNAKKTHCPKGHLLSNNRNSLGSRYCLVCKRERYRIKMQRLRALSQTSALPLLE